MGPRSILFTLAERGTYVIILYKSAQFVQPKFIWYTCVQFGHFCTNSVLTQEKKDGRETEAPMRYGPVKNVKKHEKLHRKVKKLFSAFTLFTLYAFFATTVDQ